MRIGVIGCGNICGIYFENLGKSNEVKIVSCADLDPAKAASASEKYGVPAAESAEALIADPNVDLVLNLTVPKAHHAISKQALRKQKHVYSEKPLALTAAKGADLVDCAKQYGVLLGCAPDTVLGAGIQTCRQLIDEGAIGKPLSFNAFMQCPGHESWHPAPEFYYEEGGGPMLDMGPYYLSALVTLLGAIRTVQSYAKSAWDIRTITSQPKAGTEVLVETPTHIASLLEFETGVVGHFTASFDVQQSTLPHVEIVGTEGTLLVPDPNGFGGEPKIWTKMTRTWESVPLRTPHSDNARGLGVIDLARAVKEHRAPRASGDLALHILEAMELTVAGTSGTMLSTRAFQPMPMDETL